MRICYGKEARKIECGKRSIVKCRYMFNHWHGTWAHEKYGIEYLALAHLQEMIEKMFGIVQSLHLSIKFSICGIFWKPVYFAVKHFSFCGVHSTLFTILLVFNNQTVSAVGRWYIYLVNRIFGWYTWCLNELLLINNVIINGLWIINYICYWCAST